MADSPKPKPKTVTVKLSNVTAQRLVQLAAQPGLVPDRIKRWKIADVICNRLGEVPSSPVQPAQDAAPAAWRSWEVAYTAWAKKSLPAIQLAEPDRDAVKELLRAAGEAKLLSSNKVDYHLECEFGLVGD